MTESPADEALRKGPNQGGRSVRVAAGSRLHFGLLNTAAPFGGVGVMIDRPLTEVVITPADRYDCRDVAETRIREIAERVARRAGRAELPGCQVAVTRRAPQHSGLGSGTQLALAAAEGLCRFLDIDFQPLSLASRIAVRGERSAIGVHGYFSGGLLFESADGDCPLNPLRSRVELPTDWCVAIFQPTERVANVSGDLERRQFANLSAADDDAVASLARIVSDEIIPAAEQRNLEMFAAALQRYNHDSGQLFASVQGGPYHGSAVAGLVQSLIRMGAQGVGQSSWGPGVFAWFGSRREADEFVSRMPPEISLIEIAHPRNRPRELRVDCCARST